MMMSPALKVRPVHHDASARDEREFGRDAVNMRGSAAPAS